MEKKFTWRLPRSAQKEDLMALLIPCFIQLETFEGPVMVKDFIFSEANQMNQVDVIYQKEHAGIITVSTMKSVSYIPGGKVDEFNKVTFEFTDEYFNKDHSVQHTGFYYESLSKPGAVLIKINDKAYLVPPEIGKELKARHKECHREIHTVLTEKTNEKISSYQVSRRRYINQVLSIITHFEEIPVESFHL